MECSPLLNQARCGPGKVTSDRAAIVDALTDDTDTATALSDVVNAIVGAAPRGQRAR